jgi:phosphotransferase system  glucose/maltose/N-acetylglucosamine-specific IIC component
MIELKDWQDYLPVFALAAVLGAVGGLAYELLQSRRGQTGLIEAPHKGPGKYWDSGWVGSVIVGAIAAVAALWVFPPEVSTTVAAAGKSSTITQYD